MDTTIQTINIKFWGLDATIQSKIPQKVSGMVTAIRTRLKEDSGMVIAIQSKESCMNHPTQLGLMQSEPRVLNPQYDHGTISNMWIDVLKSSILENHLITGKWCESLTSARETTSNVNGSQGTTTTIHKVWRMSWSRTLVESPDRIPLM